MQKGHVLHFDCQKCKKNLDFSIFELKQTNCEISCPECGQAYSFKDENLIRQLQKFEKLCRQIMDSEEILGDVNVGIDIDGLQVKVPYKILLARLGSTLDLKIGNTPLSIDFRMDPLEDFPKIAANIDHRNDLENNQKSVKIPLKFKVES